MHFEKWHKRFGSFDPTFESLKMFTLMFKLGKYRGVMCHYTEDRCKPWRRNDLWFYKWHEEFDRFHWNTQKFVLWETFLSKAHNVKLKNYREVICHDIEKKYISRKYINNLASYHGSSQKSENLRFDGLLLSIAYKKHRRVISHDTEEWTILWKRTFCFKNDMRN